MAATTIAAVVTALGAVVPASAALAAGSTAGIVSGAAFRDFSANGVFDSGNAAGSGIANDVGLPGVAVTAYDRDGDAVGSGVTDAAGAYSLAVNGAASGRVRVQFTLSDAQRAEGYEPGAHGAGNGTGVQFVELGATGVDFAALVPEDFIQNSPRVAVAVQAPGDPLGAGYPAGAANPSLFSSVVTLGYEQSSSDATEPTREATASGGEGFGVATGSVYGLTAQRGGTEFFAGAVLRRHTGLGAAGLGGIYRIDPASHTATLFADLDNGSGATGGNVDVGEQAFSAALSSSGASQDNAARGLSANPDDPSRDPVAWENVGKTGLGGLAMSTDGSTLYAVNLFAKTLLMIDVASKAVRSVPLGDLSADDRPFAVAVHRGAVLVGITDSAETSGLRSDLGSRVISTSEASVATPEWNTVLSVEDMTYARGAASDGAFGTPDWTSSDPATHWNAWTDDWNDGQKTLFAPSGQTWVTNAQPILSTLTFDVSGNLVLGYLDRYSYMTGMGNLQPFSPDENRYSGIAAGGVYGAAPAGDGSYELESNGVLGGVTGGGAGNGFGPGGGQYYVSRSSAHVNSFTGAVAASPGFSTFLSTGYDLTGGWTGDAGWMPVDGGETLAPGATWNGTNRAQRVLNNAGDNNSPDTLTAGFGKAGGLGAVAVLAANAPVEIGNRVWFDADRDGVQDADEPPMAGVTATLTDAAGNPVVDAAGNPVAPVTTDAEGQYYFTGLVPDASYRVVFTTPASGSWDGGALFGQIPWTTIGFTTTAAGSDRSIDSNPGADGVAVVDLGGPGQNDHTIDAGLVADVPFTVTKQIDPSGPAALAGQTFTIDLASRDFRGQDTTVSPARVTLAPGATSATITVPAGTRVKATEAAKPSIGSYTVSYGSATADADGYALVTAGATPTPTGVVVTNTLTEPGNFTITKLIEGDDVTLAELGDTKFTVAVTVGGVPAGTVQLTKANGFTYTSPDYPAGTTVTLDETAVTDAPAWAEWVDSSWSVGDSDSDGVAEFQVGEDATTALDLVNDFDVLTGGFNVLKDVTGEGAARVPAGTTFTVEYSTDGGATWVPLTVTDGQVVDGPQDLRVGTVVQLREVAPTAPADVTWQKPVFSGTGVTGGSPASLTIGSAGEVNVLLENPTDAKNGQFSLLKDVTGPGENLVTPGKTYPVTWSYDGQTGGPQTVNLVNGVAWSSPAIPTGKVVTVTEAAPTGGLPDGATWGTPSLTVDGQPAANGSTITIRDASAGEGSVVAVVVANPTDTTPKIEITKGDGATGTVTIDHEADTVETGEAYAPGETRTVIIRVVNPGPEPLREVDLSDLTTAGGAVQGLRWTFPDLTTADATWDAQTQKWSAKWGSTFAPGTTRWAVGDVITGTATLTMNASDDVHQDIASVTAVGAFSGKRVGDDNPYNAFTGGIQVIKYDGQKADPAVGGPGAWVIPTKPLADAGQDANTTDTAVAYPVDKPQKVRWVVTNIGKTWLTNITLKDVTADAPAVGVDWTADLSAFGGPTNYSFVKDGAWPGLFAPGASFFAEGTLTMPASDTHADKVTVTGTLVVPKPDPTTGKPTGDPLVKDGVPVIAKNPAGQPIVFTDDDPFHAKTPAAPVPPKGGGLASTGADLPWAPAGAAGILLLLGAAIVFAAKRRRRGDSAS